MSSKRTTVGFIGAGIIANRHMNDLLAFDDVQVTAIADVQLERAEALAARSAGRGYADFNEMLDREQLDAVYICVPPFAHGEPERAAIARDLSFFVEKPIAVDLQTAEALAETVEARGLITGVGYHWRYLDIVERARELLRDRPARLVQGYWLDSTPPPAWWIRQEQSGGQMIEQLTHIFDLARYLVGDVSHLYAAGSRLQRAAFPTADIFDVSVATLHFASGALGTMAATCLLNWPHRIGLHLFSDSQVLELSEFELMVDVGRGRPIQQAQGDPFMREDRAFIDAVQGKPNQIRATYADALATHRLATTAARAAELGQPLDVPRLSETVASRR